MIDLEAALLAAAAEVHAVDCYEPGHCARCAGALSARARAGLMSMLVAEVRRLRCAEALLAAVTAERDALDRLRVEMGARLKALTPAVAQCVRCSAALGPKFYAGVPGVGDVCLACHPGVVGKEGAGA